MIHGHPQQAVGEFWMKLWSMNLDRKYSCDLEEYSIRWRYGQWQDTYLHFLELTTRRHTMAKVDYKKNYKELYLPKSIPSIIEVPSIRYVMIHGEGDPNGEEFAMATGALYSFSYAVKMSYKSQDVPDGYYDYTVFPLEGVWDLVDKSKPSTDKSNYAYSIMIRQPDFLSDELFERFLAETTKKKPSVYLDKIKLVTITEGLCCQMLHVGSFDDEPASFARMSQFCTEHGYDRSSLKHREIYLSDPRKTESAKLKTVLRFKVSRKK
jgi:hypothetical protein